MVKKELKKTSEKNKSRSLQLGIVITLSLALLFLFGVTVADRLADRKAQNEIMRNFREYMEKDELSVIYYTSLECSFCGIQTPILKELAKANGFRFLEVESTTLSDKQKKEIFETLGIEGKTPTTVVVKNGEIVALRVGVLDGQKMTAFLITAGVLEEGTVYLPEQHLTFIDYDGYEELKNGSEPFVLVLGGVGCEWCALAKPILSNVSKAYDVQVNYLTLDYITAEEREALYDQLIEMGYDDVEFKKDKKMSTPNHFVIHNGKIIDNLEGAQNVTEYRVFFMDNNLIKN